jgi:hypothetical protein
VKQLIYCGEEEGLSRKRTSEIIYFVAINIGGLQTVGMVGGDALIPRENSIFVRQLGKCSGILQVGGHVRSASSILL